MPVIYLRHPVHGNKVAFAEAEADYDKTHGWKVYDPDEGKPKSKEKPPLEPVQPPPIIDTKRSEPEPEPETKREPGNSFVTDAPEPDVPNIVEVDAQKAAAEADPNFQHTVSPVRRRRT